MSILAGDSVKAPVLQLSLRNRAFRRIWLKLAPGQEGNHVTSSTSHHPPHIYLDNTWYMVSAAIYQHRPLLHIDGRKELVRDQLKMLTIEFDLRLTAWVILDDHYHLLFKTSCGETLPRFFGRLHGRTAFELNKLDGVRGRQVWHNYWDTCIRGEKDYWTRFTYIHHNPVKHGYVAQCEEWPFSSYRYYLEHKGQEWLMDVFRQYPVRESLEFKGFEPLESSL